MESVNMSVNSVSKKHKKHRSEKRERYENLLEKPSSLKLILKVGSQGTPEHSLDNAELVHSAGYSAPNITDAEAMDTNDPYYAMIRSHHKKSKKKKKKKDKCKDREKKHKHHHKDKKRKREESEAENTEPVLSPYPVLGSPSQHREPRTCVLKKIQEKTPLQKMLEHLLGLLEKKDPQQFFAWPVTENIAPGYSSIISQPMDFSTIRQKIEDNLYNTFTDFREDFKLMCENAMKYNHIDTIYYKTSKKLLLSGMKMLQPEKLGWLFNLIPELTSDHVGFEITPELRLNKHRDENDEDHVPESKRKMPSTKFEAIPDELTPEEILIRSQNAAREARRKLVLKKGGVPMGFLKQRKDGTTNLNILVGGDGVIPGTKKRPVLLGQLTGKLTEGTSQLAGFREDRRNFVKPVKPLYYGAFGSYAPSYDSAFSNLTKEESELVFQTYGSDTAQQYAESIMDFVKDSAYGTRLVDSLLDLLTGGDHSKTKKTLSDNKSLRDEEEAVKTVMEVKPLDSVKIDVNELKSLQSLGINMNFLDKMDEELRIAEERHELQQRLNSMCELLEKLQNVQNQRLSAPLPSNLSQCPPPSDEEVKMAETITNNLTDIAKKVNPSDIVPVVGVRKALGVSITDVEVHSEVPDLELELRQFLESESHLGHSPLRDDKTIEEMLLE